MKIIFSLLTLLVIITGFSSEIEENTTKTSYKSTENNNAISKINDNTIKPPQAIIKINNQTIQISSSTYQWEIQDLPYKWCVNADGLGPFDIAKKKEAITVSKASKAIINFSDNSKPEIHVFLWEEKERERELLLNNNQLILPTGTGRYVIEIIAKWSNGTAFYTLLIEK